MLKNLLVFIDFYFVFGNHHFQHFTVLTKLWRYLNDCALEILLNDFGKFFSLLLLWSQLPPLEGKGLGTLHYALQLSSSVVLRSPGDLLQIHRVVQVLVAFHQLCVNVEDLEPPCLVRDVDLNVHLQSAWPQNGLVQEVLAIGDTDDKDVVELIDAVDAGEQLVHD